MTFLPWIVLALAVPTALTTKPKLSIQNVSWMAGTWQGSGFDGTTEERWSSLDGGSMVGTFRLVVKDKMRLTELLMIEQEGSDVVYRFNHFSPGFKVWQPEPLTFKLISATNNVATFEGPAAQNPRRLIYSLTDHQTLVARVEGKEEKDFFELTFKRVKE